MLDSAPALQDPAAPDADAAPDPAVLRAERRLAVLAELVEIGMELARTLKPGLADTSAEDDGAGRAKLRDPADAFAPLSRAIRLTLALEAKTDAELSDLKAGIVRVSEERRTRAAERRQAAAAKDAEGRFDRVRELVVEAAEAEIGDLKTFNQFVEALDERLEEDEAYADIDRRPLRETVESLCRDLKLSPDWSRWTGDGWIDAWPTRPVFSPFNQPSAKPLHKPPRRTRG
jgi:hypothetical protein